MTDWTARNKKLFDWGKNNPDQFSEILRMGGTFIMDGEVLWSDSEGYGHRENKDKGAPLIYDWGCSKRF